MNSLQSSDNKVVFQTLATIAPEEVSFRVGFDSTMFEPDWKPTLYQTYGSSPFPFKPRSEQGNPKFKNYIYTDSANDGSRLWLYYALDKTEAQMKTPVRVKQDSKQWRWPDVLYSLQFVPDDEFPLVTQFPIPRDPNTGVLGGTGTVFAQRVYERYNLKPATLALCRIEERWYTSARPFPAKMLTHPQPTEGNISWSFNGAQGSLTCLHPLIKIPARGLAYTTVVNATTGASPAPPLPEAIFPATIFEDWEPFTLYDDVAFEGGVWSRKQGIIFPPEGPEPNKL